MLGRVALLLAFLATVGGCAVAEERLARMEADIAHLQGQEVRLAVLEDTMHTIISGKRVEAPAREDEPRTPEKTSVPASRRVEPAPVKAPAAQPAQVKPVPVKSGGNASQEYQAALAMLEAGRPTVAAGLFRDFTAAHSAHSLAPNAGYWLGECYYTLKQYDSAIIAFKDVVAQFPAHDKAAAAMLKAGYSYLQLDDTPNARFYLEMLLKDYPASKPAALARERLAAL